MKFFFISILIAAISSIFFLSCTEVQQSNKGAYIISLESWNNGQRIFKFPDDSIFLSGNLAVQKLMRLDQYDINGKISVVESLDVYYLIDFKKGLYKDMGKDLEQETEKIPWKNLNTKRLGFDFLGDWYFNENFKIKDTLYESITVKKITYTAGNRQKYDILLGQPISKNKLPLFFGVIEERFKGQVESYNYLSRCKRYSNLYHEICYP